MPSGVEIMDNILMDAPSIVAVLRLQNERTRRLPAWIEHHSYIRRFSWGSLS